ncbi:hypothetical protein ATK74_2311 [Propionicimonas paludicola]|uniref:DUF7657 domain-containing protein n=1 Tax=Propionicimonas paludicola TaxID=185243 RepID=A0A2A9CTP3_9ACTN|nr:hypothetical protein ATK74_2311 [Propionicimonas paludicola]
MRHSAIGRGLVGWLSFPLLVLVGTAALVWLRISGSSIGALALPAFRSGLLWGTPRGVRSDEFQLTTPSNVSSVVQGFPADPWVGLAPTNLDVAVHSGISTDWTALFHPDHWGYILLGAERGLAFSWWWPFTICLLGTYALIGFIVRRPATTAALAMVATFTPYSAWWSAAPPALVLGYGAALGACILGATAVRRIVATAGLSALGAFLAVCFTLVLYPPWAISVAIVVAAIGIGRVVDLRLSWTRCAIVIGSIAATGGAILAVWYVQNSRAIAAMTNTYYPGHRITVPGSGWPYQFFSAPLNFWMAGPAGSTVGKIAGLSSSDNLSENASSWFPLAALLLLVCWGLAPGARRLSRRVLRRSVGQPTSADDSASAWTLGLVSAATALLLAWFFLPVPGLVGTLTLLDRVQPGRLPLALGFAAVAIGAVALASPPRRLRALLVWGGAAAVIDGLLALWTMTTVPWDWSTVAPALVFLSGFVLSAGFVLLSAPRGRAGATAVLAGYAVVSWFLVNPVQVGLGPLKTDPLVRGLQAATQTSTNKRIMVFGGASTIALVRAAGLQSVSGQTPIPDADVMTALAPADELLWNNYVKYDWQPGPAGSDAKITNQRGSLMTLTIDPCSAELQKAVGPGWALSRTRLDGYSCLREAGTLTHLGGAPEYLYRVQS